MSNQEPVKFFTKFLQETEDFDYSHIFATANAKYHIRELKVVDITPQTALKMFTLCCKRVQKNSREIKGLSWNENELRLFAWILIVYVNFKKIEIEELGTEDWNFFKEIYPNKKEILFQYQSRTLLKESSSVKAWNSEEDKLFCERVKPYIDKYKWSEIAKQLYIESERLYFRTPKQCRERWLNHLDPSKTKQDWKPNEDLLLVGFVKISGKKWAAIAKLLDNKRNQHAIKNRFKSLLTREEKYHVGEFLSEGEILDRIIKKIKASTEGESTQIKFDKGSSRHTAMNAMLPENSKTEPKKQFTFFIKNSSFKRYEDGIQNPIKTEASLKRQENQNERMLRADLFLVQDPFEALKPHFGSDR